MRELLDAGHPLLRNPASRLAFVRENEERLLLFVDGETIVCEGDAIALAERLCAQVVLNVDPQWLSSDPILTLLTDLYNRGSLAFDWS